MVKIGPDDPPPVETINPDGAAAVLLVCDHASAAVPACLDHLGIALDQFERHIAYDIGAAGVTRHLSRDLDAPAVLAGYSRLVIDLNRPPGHPQSIPEVSDGTVIPGNNNLAEDAGQARVAALFDPYHEAVNQGLAHLWRRGTPAVGTPPALFSIHSFSPGYGDEDRPWDAGVLWNRDPRIARPLIEKLEALGLHVGDNLPYSGRELAYTLNLHGAAAGLANCVIEINQDQVMDSQGIERWAGILAGVMKEILQLDGLHEVREF
ncbi:MAG: N-formylglutamate amidohydrolase [Proteobacteria bacterium]|nr:N-formylglutamate amidohydrolase [Pseudomonadota bacterium]MDA1022751.1 N-formylglutamate amidohydrolase [Pseudomonadota bacterium]